MLEFETMVYWIITAKKLPKIPMPDSKKSITLSRSDRRIWWQFKGQLISEWTFGAYKSPKEPTKFLTDFSPSFIGHKSVQNLVGFLGDLKKTKFHSDIKLTFSNLLIYICLWSLELRVDPGQAWPSNIGSLLNFCSSNSLSWAPDSRASSLQRHKAVRVFSLHFLLLL